MTSVLSGVTNTFWYSFVPGTAMVSGMANSAGLGWTRTYEPARNLIAAVSNFWNGTAVSAFGYENDAAGRRTLRLDAAPSLSATNVFAYNQRSEVTNAAMGSANYSYSFDDIGNRKWATAGSSLNTYAANALNQYVVVTNAGIDMPVGYDLDGNMTVNGDWLYDWDGENNLWLAQQSVQTNGSLLVENGYDYLKRRWYKRVDVLTGQEPPSGSPPMPGEPGEFVPSKTTYFVWDGWNTAAEINIDETLGTTNVTRYIWGLDLSGSVQGAGGVGGLLAVIEGDGSINYPCYDANGNITEYVDATGAVRAHREFDAFGNTTVKTGDLADSFRFWFSTKILDEETGNYVYQQRQYKPSLGRWASRDPISETDNPNLYATLSNKIIDSVDYLGLSDLKFIVGGNLNTEHGSGVSGDPAAIVQEGYLRAQIQLAIEEYNRENNGKCALEIEYALSSPMIPMTLERLKTEVYSPAGTGASSYVLIFHGRRIREFKENKKNGLREIVVGETGLVLIDEVRKDTGFTTPFAVGRPYRMGEIFNSETEIADTAKDFYVSCCYSAKLSRPLVRSQEKRFLVLGKATDARTSVGEAVLEIKNLAKELCCRKTMQSK